MERDFVIKKCSHCGAVVRVIRDCEHCSLTCCGEKMVTQEANSVDASFEKHIPMYELAEGKLTVFVSHVMDDDHFIEWIAFVSNDKEELVFLKPGMEARVQFDILSSGKLYAYCNQHGLWMKEFDQGIE